LDFNVVAIGYTPLKPDATRMDEACLSRSTCSLPPN